MKQTLGIVASAIGLFALSTVPAHAQNLLTTNPGFEAGPYNFNVQPVGWSGNNPSGYFGATDAGQSGKDGLGFGYAGNGGILATAIANRAAVSSPGTEEFTLTFQAQLEAGSQPTTFALDFFNASGISLGGNSLNFVPGGDLATGYSVNAIAPIGAATAGARVTTVSGGQVRFDNFVLTSVNVVVVPEAGTLALLATGAIGAVGMVVRRKKSA